MESYLPCNVKKQASLTKSMPEWDFICIISKDDVPALSGRFNESATKDKAFHSEVSCFTTSEFDAPIIYSPVGELKDYDDVRNYGNAAAKAMQRAFKAGAKSPLLILPNKSAKYDLAGMNTLMGALAELYVPIQVREDVPSKQQRLSVLGVYMDDQTKLDKLIQTAKVLESGRYVARDIGGGDPERMAPPRVADYIQKLFPAGGPITVEIISDVEIFEKEYPLFQAVNRAAHSVERHRGRIIFLEYKPPKPARKTLMFVGKGVTYDTGGADIKAGGIMAGMSRDKCGAAVVAGFMKIVQETKPEDIHVFAALCMVRNSVGEECYVADEIITSRAGVRVRVGNTDAEGRFAMADALCRFRELAQNLPNPHLFTVATLTGHACLAVGKYSICVDNAPARADKHAYKLKEVSEAIGDPFEISTLREEDFEFHAGKSYGDDLLQCNNAPSSRTPRGHITPAAFLIVASGLDKNGLTSEKPLKFSHLDIAGSSGDLPDPPTAASVLALVKTHL